MEFADIPISLLNRASRIAASMERCRDEECRPTVIAASWRLGRVVPSPWRFGVAARVARRGRLNPQPLTQGNAMIPKSLALGATLTLTACERGLRRLGEPAMQWQPDTSHRGLGVPRRVVALRATFAELGDERSRLDYPTRAEVEVDGDGTLSLCYREDGGGACADTAVRLTYRVA